jgi:hypothetical protein
VVAVVALITALVATDAAGARFRDPDNVAAKYFLAVGLGVVLPRRARRLDPGRPADRHPAAVARRHARGPRGALDPEADGRRRRRAAELLHHLPLLPEPQGHAPPPAAGELFDRQLAAIDRDLFAGNDPAELLHGLLGTGGLPTHVLSTFYAAFIVFLPLCMGLALVFSRDLSTSLFFVTALSLNWLFGIASYFLLPALGPVYADPGAFASLPYSRSRGCRRCCATTASRTCATRTSGPPRRSRRSPRSTSR